MRKISSHEGAGHLTSATGRYPVGYSFIVWEHDRRRWAEGVVIGACRADPVGTWLELSDGRRTWIRLRAALSGEAAFRGTGELFTPGIDRPQRGPRYIENLNLKTANPRLSRTGGSAPTFTRLLGWIGRQFRYGSR